MKTALLYIKSITFYAFLPGITFVSWFNNHHDKGPHGGNLEKADGQYIEMRIADKFLYAYLLDSKLKTVDSRGVSGQVKFLLPDSSTFNASLKPYAENAYVVENTPEFRSCVIQFNTPSRSVSARFESHRLVVQKN